MAELVDVRISDVKTRDLVVDVIKSGCNGRYIVARYAGILLLRKSFFQVIQLNLIIGVALMEILQSKPTMTTLTLTSSFIIRKPGPRIRILGTEVHKIV